jgi:hypothetical protein
VLLLALEDSDRRLQDRIRTLIPGEPIPGRLYYMTRIQQGGAVATIEAWLETLPSGVRGPARRVPRPRRLSWRSQSGPSCVTIFQRAAFGDKDHRAALAMQRINSEPALTGLGPRSMTCW